MFNHQNTTSDTIHLMMWLGSFPTEFTVESSWSKWKPVKVNYLDRFLKFADSVPPREQLAVMLYHSKFLSNEDQDRLRQEISKKTNTILVDFEDIIQMIPSNFTYSFDQSSEDKKQIEDSFDYNGIYHKRNIKESFFYSISEITQEDLINEYNLLCQDIFSSSTGVDDKKTKFGIAGRHTMANVANIAKHITLFHKNTLISLINKQLSKRYSSENKTFKPENHAILYHDLDVNMPLPVELTMEQSTVLYSNNHGISSQIMLVRGNNNPYIRQALLSYMNRRDYECTDTGYEKEANSLENTLVWLNRHLKKPFPNHEFKLADERHATWRNSEIIQKVQENYNQHFEPNNRGANETKSNSM